MTTRKELLDKAEELNLQFPKNISTVKLEELIIETLEDEVTPPAIPDIPDTSADSEPEQEVSSSKKIDILEHQRNCIKSAKEKAFATRIVTLTNKDNRENNAVTTAYLSFENQHFGLSKLVPLDVAVELEQGLIDIAEATAITLHKDEIIDGKSTGNKVPVQVKKFAISYSNMETMD